MDTMMIPVNTSVDAAAHLTSTLLIPEARDPRANVLYCAALLSGVGENTVTLLNDLGALGQSKEGRTCIDAGSQVMFSLLAPGARGLRVLVRVTDGDENGTTWRRIYYRPDGSVEYWQTRVFIGEKAAAWEQARAAASQVDGEQRLKRYHAALGPHGHIYCVAWSDAAVSISWQLDRGYPPEVALANSGLVGDWRAALETLRVLLGQYPSPRVGPWSITHYLHEDTPRVRIGTTSWARQIEDGAKRQRLAALFDQVGGDGRFAEGLYKLISSVSESNARIGRAVEVELVDGQVTAVECFLCLPEMKNHPHLVGHMEGTTL
jgi:hypothetical protein